ncbi:NAD-dependent DNA ligase LigA, partial [bacterium]|nr:NAD-dependent DNA ligase LigA [bacterium]
MPKNEAKIKIEKLKKEIDKIRYHYHVLDDLIVPEGVKDSLQHELELLEQEYPDLITPDSPTQRVAGKPLDKFKKIEHSEPMISLSDTFSKEELEKWETRNKKIVDKNYSYFAELKIDGFAVSLIYKNGLFFKGATRGDGKVGEDITQNLRTIESIPLKLKEVKGINLNQTIEVRGEVYLSKKEFDRINAKQKKKKMPIYANPR